MRLSEFELAGLIAWKLVDRGHSDGTSCSDHPHWLCAVNMKCIMPYAAHSCKRECMSYSCSHIPKSAHICLQARGQGAVTGGSHSGTSESDKSLQSSRGMKQLAADFEARRRASGAPHPLWLLAAPALQVAPARVTRSPLHTMLLIVLSNIGASTQIKGHLVIP